MATFYNHPMVEFANISVPPHSPRSITNTDPHPHSHPPSLILDNSISHWSQNHSNACRRLPAIGCLPRLPAAGLNGRFPPSQQIVKQLASLITRKATDLALWMRPGPWVPPPRPPNALRYSYVFPYFMHDVLPLLIPEKM